VLAAIGALTLAVWLVRFGWGCWVGIRSYILSQYWSTDLRRYGRWAVVTGATSGIGRAYADELARRGLDVVLISRSAERLQAAAREIASQYGCAVQVLQADFTEGGGIYPGIASALTGLDIGILVNNVGMNYTSKLAHFLDVPNAEERITQLINCNILSVTQMSRIVLPQMIDRGRGLIINISSEAASRPQPLLTLYSASKIFLTYFSRCLHAEYRSRGVTVQCVTPFMVSTNMTGNLPVSPLVKRASDYAREALDTVGHSTFTSGCLSHALQHATLTVVFPGWYRLSRLGVHLTERYGQSV
ncbi:DHB12 reductase, partial [Amia calva]|nr:DHB12 reductase [Amia calva]